MQDMPSSGAGSWNKFAGMDFKQMLQSARVFVSTGFTSRYPLSNPQRSQTRMGEGVKLSGNF